MTEREFLTAVANSENIEETLREQALERIDKLNMRNQNRTSKPSPKQLENIALKEKIMTEIFAGDMELIVNAAIIGSKLEISTQKASALLGQLAKSGDLVKFETKEVGRGKVMAYRLATEE